MGLLLIERYCEYFECYVDYLLNVLNFFFVVVGDFVFGGFLVWLIFIFCFLCCIILIGEVGIFIRYYQDICGRQVFDVLVEERIVFVVVFIIQFIMDENEKLQKFEEFYMIFKKDFEFVVQFRLQFGLVDLINLNVLRGFDFFIFLFFLFVEGIFFYIVFWLMRCIVSMLKGM